MAGPRRDTVRHLVDKSALARAHHAEVRARLTALEASMCGCTVTDLEVLFSARSLRDWDRLRDRQTAVPHLPVTDADLDRAVAVQRVLAASGHHRGPSVPDLVLAAVAEANDAVVVHYDRGFETIAAVTGQATQWVVPAGTVP